jgi:hypothetical protein
LPVRTLGNVDDDDDEQHERPYGYEQPHKSKQDKEAVGPKNVASKHGQTLRRVTVLLEKDATPIGFSNSRVEQAQIEHCSAVGCALT